MAKQVKTQTQEKEATLQPEAEKKEQVSEEKPVQTIAPHTEIVWHGSVNGLECYSYTSQQILDVADMVYALYKQTPTIHLYGECLYGDKIIRLKQEQAEYKNVVDDSWHLSLLDIDVLPINGTIIKARIGVTRPGAFERWEETPERKTYHAKLLDSIKK